MAPVGPATCTLEPPNTPATIPATMAVISPAVAPRPVVIPNAKRERQRDDTDRDAGNNVPPPGAPKPRVVAAPGQQAPTGWTPSGGGGAQAGQQVLGLRERPDQHLFRRWRAAPRAAGRESSRRRAEPSLRVETTPARRSTASCWERCDGSSPTNGWISLTERSPVESSSSTWMRAGWARALNRSALSSAIGWLTDSWLPHLGVRGSIASFLYHMMNLSYEEIDSRNPRDRPPARIGATGGAQPARPGFRLAADAGSRAGRDRYQLSTAQIATATQTAPRTVRTAVP